LPDPKKPSIEERRSLEKKHRGGGEKRGAMEIVRRAVWGGPWGERGKPEKAYLDLKGKDSSPFICRGGT